MAEANQSQDLNQGTNQLCTGMRFLHLPVPGIPPCFLTNQQSPHFSPTCSDPLQAPSPNPGGRRI
uniref:TSL n=1 Tax=Homo sapiens TaxID=9606 RepID=A0ZNI9_HUMAN|nr:TSL [Homo sapiens]BAF42047.1 TSL [Homo sapiens]BAF42048.1 TSL [Homo sapiens]